MPRSSRRHRRITLPLLAALAAAALLVSPARGAEAADPTAAGEVASGWWLGDSGLWVGGYINNALSLPDGGPASITLSDVGLLLRYQVTPTISLFNETDLDESLIWEDGKGVQLGSRVLLLERLYAEWQPLPELTLRLGKFLTPFGLWNLVRRAPLTWTVNAPLIADSLFPDHITGAESGFQTTLSGWTLDATAYGQATDELYPGASDTVPTAAGGGRASGGRSIGPVYLEVGASAVAFDNESTEHWQDGVGTDLSCTGFGNFLQAEFTYGHQFTGPSVTQLGAYLQDAFPIVHGLWGVVRFEYFDPATGGAVNGQLIGLAWRPLPWVFLKADYQFANRSYGDLDRGFVAAVVLFF
jgi:hypothetical protein